jgi:general stress protein 26
MVHRGITFEERLAQAAEFLASKRAIVLATCTDDHVTARTVSFASRGAEVCFMSFSGNTKCRQIEGNSRVALCRDNVQIEGTAGILGSVLSPENAPYAALLREKLPEDFRRYAGHPRMILIRVRPERVKIFYKEGEEFLVDWLDMQRRTLTVEQLASASC